MILSEVFVRSIMQFGAPVWATPYINSSVVTEHAVLKPLLVLHRRMLRMLLGVDRTFHNVLLYIVSGRLPLKLML